MALFFFLPEAYAFYAADSEHVRHSAAGEKPALPILCAGRAHSGHRAASALFKQ